VSYKKYELESELKQRGPQREL